ncbi:CPBP family intramembrane glutamic endopeptidase [Candidatus Protochlamydia phocaeensis]|uniref:CPBP family intramembrane glutamic endopeptidase n=1 Tax=Candidatus Protochlamydia phocaeensis TaxID=1414722 RepID=UPI000838FF45|nr:CPBP family intramembrane glutamic endopeptidase [Candidatus Protochlamydia phocaeensis]
MLQEAVINEEIQQHLVLIFLGLLIGAGLLFLAWRNGAFHSFTPSFLPKIKGREVLKGFAAFLLAELVMVPALVVVGAYVLMGKILTASMLSPELKGWINIGVVFGGFIGVWSIYRGLPAEKRGQFWQARSPWYKQVFVGMIAWLVSYPLVIAFSQLISLIVLALYRQPELDQVAVRHMKSLLSDPLIFSITAIEVICLVPFTEEFLFRGLLQSWLKSKFNHVPLAIVLTSLLFAIFHYSGSQGLTNIELLSSLFVLSCVLGYIYEKQHSLWAPIGMHAFFNLMNVLLIFKY